MQTIKEYKLGGFFGNSQEKFADMEGSQGGINMAFKGHGPFAGKGSALRREKRWLKKLEKKGMLNDSGPQSAERLDYLRNVQKDRAKKGVAGYLAANALIGGAIVGGPALAAKFGAKGLSGLAGKLGGKGALKKAGQFALQNPGMVQNLIPKASEEDMQNIDDGNFGQPDMYGKYGMRVKKAQNGMKFTPEQQKMLMAMLGARLPR